MSERTVTQTPIPVFDIRIEPEDRPLIRTICALSDAHLDWTLARHSRAV